MFGGIGFMLNGNLLVGASKRGLLLRVGKDRQSQALAKPGTRQMEMRGRPMDGYIYLDPPIELDAVRAWVDMAIAFVRTLPPKTKAKRRPTRESVSREIEQLTDAGLIETTEGKIFIKDIGKLGQEFSEPVSLNLWGLQEQS